MNIQTTLKRILFIATLGFSSAFATGPVSTDSVPNQAVTQKKKWKFASQENKTLMKVLGSVGRKAEAETMAPIVKLLETGALISDLRKQYNKGELEGSAFLTTTDNAVSKVAGLLEFLSVAGGLMDEAFEKSDMLDLAQYEARDPLLKTLIGLEQQEQEKRLHGAMKDVTTALEVLDQVLAVREALLNNMPLGLKIGLAVHFGRQNPEAKGITDEKELRALGQSEVVRLFS